MWLVIAPVSEHRGGQRGSPPLGDQAGQSASILCEEWANRQKCLLPVLDLNHTPNRGEFTAQNRAHPVYPIIAMPVPNMGPYATAVVNDHRPTIRVI